MFHFFSKKVFLKDLLEGFVDIHSHILPGIDDGAKNTSESIDLIKGLQALGVKQFMPTPHVMQDFYPNTDETIGNAYQKLLGALDSKMLSEITINPAAEYMLDDNFQKQLETQELFTLKGNYLLIEMSYFQPPINLEEIISKIKSKGYLPILAHPERYPFYHNTKGYYLKLKQLGCFFQLNLLSLSEHYGKNVEKTAHYLIEEQLIDFVATDTHHADHIEKLSNLTLHEDLAKKLANVIKNTCSTFSVI
ncbi:tyrosine-protein phosphatase [Hwangdonia lutea]|uniref:protein-tyrosine-phosphatase n=1 Tax=Hwangdonia lutea TaxID=3075823 RepID=A0AA97HPU1_9FLAO|nr:CpsB/CapC family capsule biosynthesis tyrosine phosphatase [Hwangdonia sp. SCSIO 19198]WOD43351.1 CpsB/CapC family capsule biosynthesis tyrosine phosphatase [Hwangdonia sp. SCSIO 19198]